MTWPDWLISDDTVNITSFFFEENNLTGEVEADQQHLLEDCMRKISFRSISDMAAALSQPVLSWRCTSPVKDCKSQKSYKHDRTVRKEKIEYVQDFTSSNLNLSAIKCLNSETVCHP